MKYLNQLKFEYITYTTNTREPSSDMNKGSVKLAGCGLCCLCMVVEHLTLEELPLERCLEMSMQIGANYAPGTDMNMLGPIVAEKYGLTFSVTDDLEQAMAHLRRGGRVIANVGGDRDDGAYTGVFSHGGHYITLVSTDDKEICVLDPSWRPDKFDEPGREGKVRKDGYFVYCTPQILDRDADNRSPRYYLFARK